MGVGVGGIDGRGAHMFISVRKMDMKGGVTMGKGADRALREQGSLGNAGTRAMEIGKDLGLALGKVNSKPVGSEGDIGNASSLNRGADKLGGGGQQLGQRRRNGRRREGGGHAG